MMTRVLGKEHPDTLTSHRMQVGDNLFATIPSRGIFPRSMGRHHGES